MKPIGIGDVDHFLSSSIINKQIEALLIESKDIPKTYNMNKATVSIVKATEYDCDLIYSAVVKGIDLIGGIDSIIKQGSKVFIKINHLPPPSTPERGIITHPVFVEAVLKLVKQVTDNITVGDDIESGGKGFKISGFYQMCQRMGVRLINLKETGFIETPCNGKYLKTVHISKVALDADVILNLPKLKTHSLTILTGAVKNMYGTIPDSLRKRFHFEYKMKEHFSHVLTDIFSAVVPQLTIMDCITAMEGYGPSQGNLRKLGIVLASKDAVALDAVATKIIGLDPPDIYTTRFSHERGLGIGNVQNIEVVGESLADVTVPDFKAPAIDINILIKGIPIFLSRYLANQMPLKPIVIESQCTGCHECHKICPVGAITIQRNIVKINEEKCIKCMCCHEVCRFYAIRLKRSTLGSIIKNTSRVYQKLMSMTK